MPKRNAQGAGNIRQRPDGRWEALHLHRRTGRKAPPIRLWGHTEGDPAEAHSGPENR